MSQLSELYHADVKHCEIGPNNKSTVAALCPRDTIQIHVRRFTGLLCVAVSLINCLFIYLKGQLKGT